MDLDQLRLLHCIPTVRTELEPDWLLHVYVCVLPTPVMHNKLSCCIYAYSKHAGQHKGSCCIYTYSKHAGQHKRSCCIYTYSKHAGQHKRSCCIYTYSKHAGQHKRSCCNTHIASMLDSTRVHAAYSENAGQCRHPCCTKLDIQVGRNKNAAQNVDRILEITGQLGKQSK